MALDEQQAVRDSAGDLLPVLLQTGATGQQEARASGALAESLWALAESTERVSVSSGAADQ